MATSDVAVTPGSGKNLATHSFTEDAKTKEVSRVNMNKSDGTQHDYGAGTGGSATPRVIIDSSQLGSLGQTTASSSISVIPASDSTLVTSIKVDDAAFTPGTTPVQMVGFQADESSTDSVDEGDAGAPRMTLDRKIITTPQPHSAGGLSLFRSLDLDEFEEDIKTSAGCLYKLRMTNLATSLRYVKIYNATAANVTVGSTTPVETIVLPPAAASGAIVVTETFGGIGLAFDTAISIAATTGLADNDTGAPGANEVVVSAYYK